MLDNVHVFKVKTSIGGLHHTFTWFELQLSPRTRVKMGLFMLTRILQARHLGSHVNIRRTNKFNSNNNKSRASLSAPSNNGDPSLNGESCEGRVDNTSIKCFYGVSEMRTSGGNMLSSPTFGTQTLHHEL